MDKLSLIILLLFINIFGISQTFEKYYKTELDDAVHDAVQLDEDNAAFVINSGVYPENYNSKLVRLNLNNGDFSDKVDMEFSFPDYSFGGIWKILQYDNSLILIGTCVHNATDDMQIYFARYSTGLEYIMDTIIGKSDTDENLTEVIFSSDSLLVFSGRYEFGNLLLEERDINGVLIREATYTNGGMLASTITEIPSENVYHLYRFWDSNHSFNVINKNDLTVDTVIQYPIYSPRNAVSVSDSSYYYVAGHKQIADTNGLYYTKVSNSGEILQNKIYNTDSITFYTRHCFSIHNSKIFFAGAYPCTWISPLDFYPEQRWILMYQLNHVGTIAWQKFYKGDMNFMPYKVLATTDGGALIFSSFYDWNDPIPYQRDVHILKIDSTGYYTPLVGTEEVLLQMERQILVYPNPVKTSVNFAFGLYKDLEICIIDISGNEIVRNTYQHTPTIDLSGHKPGIYLYTITGKNGFFEEGKLVKE